MSLLWLESTVSPFNQEIMKIMFVVIFFSDQNLFLRDCKHYLNLILHAKRGIPDLQRHLLKICVHRQILRYVYPHIYVLDEHRKVLTFKGTVVNRTFT